MGAAPHMLESLAKHLKVAATAEHSLNIMFHKLVVALKIYIMHKFILFYQ
jgi:hypothetical protein